MTELDLLIQELKEKCRRLQAEIKELAADTEQICDNQFKCEWCNAEIELPSDSRTVLALVSGRPTQNIGLIDVYQLAEYTEEDGWYIHEFPRWKNAEVSFWTELPQMPTEKRK